MIVYSIAFNDKDELIKLLHEAAVMYYNYYLKYTYLIIINEYSYPYFYYEVVAKKENFLHLTGLKTRLSPKRFLMPAWKEPY